MKKLLVVLAVLFATVATYATEGPETATGNVNVTVTCPFDLLGPDNAIDVTIVAGTTKTGIEDVLDFTLKACANVGDNETTYTGTLEETVGLDLSVVPPTDDYNVAIAGKWYYNGNLLSTDLNPTSIADQDFDGNDIVTFELNEVDAADCAVIPDAPLTWVVTVTATPTW